MNIKKITFLLFISLTLFFTTDVCNAEISTNKVINNDLTEEIKRYYNDNIDIYVVWFKDNIKPKVENAFNKIIPQEEFAKEKEEIKEELPIFLNQIFSFFKSFFN